MKCPICKSEMQNEGILTNERGLPLHSASVLYYRCHACSINPKKANLGHERTLVNGDWYFFYSGWHKLILKETDINPSVRGNYN